MRTVNKSKEYICQNLHFTDAKTKFHLRKTFDLFLETTKNKKWLGC